jgi:hypothetical protein
MFTAEHGRASDQGKHAEVMLLKLYNKHVSIRFSKAFK